MFYRQISLAMAIGLVASAITAPLPVLAQGYGQPQSDKNPNWPPKKYSGPAPQNKDYLSKKLNKEPEMPFVPQYTGKKAFIDATSFPAVNGTYSLNARYYMKDKAEDVRDWYVGAFRSSGWALPQQNQTKRTLLATMVKQGLTVQVTVTDGIVNGYKSQMYLRYISSPKPQQ